MPYITILNEFTSKFKMHIYVPSVFFHKHIDIRVLLWLTKSQKPDWFIAGSEKVAAKSRSTLLEAWLWYETTNFIQSSRGISPSCSLKKQISFSEYWYFREPAMTYVISQSGTPFDLYISSITQLSCFLRKTPNWVVEGLSQWGIICSFQAL